MNKKFNYILNGVCLGWSITNINETISFILLIISLVNILWNIGYKIYKRFKDGEIDKISDDLKEGKSQLEDLQNKISNKEEK